jgi:alkanesulfonate monooxygenase SsuD/methylene tetrahydromethanopterin reductase-like flavin-dependent oxidoreductase (luciferase family)
MRLVHDGQLRLAAFYPSAPYTYVLTPALHDRVPDVLDAAAHRAFVETAERTGFDFVFAAESYATFGERCKELKLSSPQLSAQVAGTYAAACTTRLGIVTTMQLMYMNPIVIARVGATLDVLSGGRWGLNMVSGASMAEGLVPEPARSLSHDERYELAEESMDIICRLWSGERLEHDGKYFQVSGELIHPLPVQKPRPAIVSAGSSGAGLGLAARFADVLFVPSSARSQIGAIRAKLDDAVIAAGRAPEDVKMQTNLMMILRDTDEEAQEFMSFIRETVDLDAVREYIATISGLSWTYRDLTRPEVDRTEEELRTIGSGQNTARIVGSPETVANELISLHEAGIRGIAINFVLWNPSELQRFSDTVMPLLREAGIWSPPQERGWSW